MRFRVFNLLGLWCRQRFLQSKLIALIVCFGAFADVESAVKSQYDRCLEATSLKYLDGIYCIRAPGFRLFNPDGLLLDLSVERNRMEQFLAPAISVKETYAIQSFQVLSEERVRCVVLYTTRAVLPNRLTGKLDEFLMRTKCVDDWLRTKKGWLLSQTRVIEQDYQR